MDDYRLVGFISDLNGNQTQLFTADPVLKHDDDLYVAEARNWTRDDLRKVQASALRFVEPVPEDEQINLQPGEVVWLAGRTFVAELSRISRTPYASLAQLRREIGRWNRTRRMGFAWTTGTRSQFTRLIAEPTTDITAMLQNALFDRQELSHGDAESYFTVFRALVQKDTLDHLVTRALYYRERHDDRRMLSVARRAVRAGVATDQNEFLAALEARAGRLGAQRLADVNRESRPQSAVRNDILALLSSVVVAEREAAAVESGNHWRAFETRVTIDRSREVAAKLLATMKHDQLPPAAESAGTHTR